MKKRSESKAGVTAFMTAAVAAPITFLAAAPCGLVCGSCPLGGACLLSSPVAFGFVWAVQTRDRRRLKKAGLLEEEDEEDPDALDDAAEEARKEWKNAHMTEPGGS